MGNTDLVVVIVVVMIVEVAVLADSEELCFM
jgi:hypothetical protein